MKIKFITEDSEQTHKQILLKLFNRKVYTTEEREATKHGLAWKIETDSISIKEKRKHLSKTSDRVSKMLKCKCLKFEVIREKIHRSIYR